MISLKFKNYFKNFFIVLFLLLPIIIKKTFNKVKILVNRFVPVLLYDLHSYKNKLEMDLRLLAFLLKLNCKRYNMQNCIRNVKLFSFTTIVTWADIFNKQETNGGEPEPISSFGFERIWRGSNQSSTQQRNSTKTNMVGKHFFRF